MGLSFLLIQTRVAIRIAYKCGVYMCYGIYPACEILIFLLSCFMSHFNVEGPMTVSYLLSHSLRKREAPGLILDFVSHYGRLSWVVSGRLQSIRRESHGS